MATVIPSEAARERNTTPRPVPFFDDRLRYDIPESAYLLKQSVSKTWTDIREGRLRAFRDGGRTFVAGVEIARRCNPETFQPRRVDAVVTCDAIPKAKDSTPETAIGTASSVTGPSRRSSRRFPRSAA